MPRAKKCLQMPIASLKALAILTGLLLALMGTVQAQTVAPQAVFAPGAGGELSISPAQVFIEGPGDLDPMISGQLEVSDLTSAEIASFVFRQNPVFSDKVTRGELPPVEQRLPAEPLILIPHQSHGRYGGTLRGLVVAPESSTSEVLSWRQVNLVRIADDLQTILPNVAKSWIWNGEHTEITFNLRRGHKWSDGAPFSADDVVFFIEDIINNPEIHGVVPPPWNIGDGRVTAVALDAVTVRITFPAPFYGFLHYIATNGSYFSVYAPRHFLEQYHIDYNRDANRDAQRLGYADWVGRFQIYWNKWKDSVATTAEGMKVPTLDSHVLETRPNTRRRTYVANPYYFKVDTKGAQLPYITRIDERMLNKELWPLTIMNGEVDQKSQSIFLVNFPILKAAERAGGYQVSLPTGQSGPVMAFNQTHEDPGLRTIYSDVRFRQAMSLAINRDELNEILFLGMGRPQAAVPMNASFVSESDKSYLTDFDPDAANQLLDSMGLWEGQDGFRMRQNGEDFIILWEYSLQSTGSEEFPLLVADYWRHVGINVLLKEVTTQYTRERASVNALDIVMEWDVPLEVTLISSPELYVPPYNELGPLMGIPWRDWFNSFGLYGEEPPAWVLDLYMVKDEWLTVVPGSARFMELGQELVRINLENLPIIGTVGDVPLPNIVSNRLGNVPEFTMSHFNYGYTYPYRPDQWFFKD